MAVVWLLFGCFSIAFSAQIKLAWDANGEADLAGYKVYHGTASQSYGNPTNVGNVTSYTLTGLTEGQTYYICLTAYDSSSNESAPSNEVSGVATIPSQTVAITIAASPTGRLVTVDGATLTAPQTFNWAAGSSHTIGVSSPQNGTSGTRYVFASWSDGEAQTHAITVPSSAVTYTATFTTQYSLTAGASAGGTVSPSGTNWYNSAQPITVTGTPSAGYSFLNWSGDHTGPSNPASITMNGPKSVTANFAHIQYTLDVGVNPAGSGSVSKSPSKATYTYGEQVTLTAAPGTNYSFSNWSGDLTGATNPSVLTINGNKTVTAIFNSIPETVSTPPTPGGPSSGTTGTAYTYTTGGYTSNLGHSIEYRFDWGEGTYSDWSSSTSASKAWSSAGTYSVRAQARCATHTGVVSPWSDSISVSVTQTTVSCTVATSPAGLRITVDETNYDAPHTFNWIPGTVHTLSVDSPQGGASGTRYVYSNWSDGGSQMRTITVPSSAAMYTANFATQYSLTTSANPPAGGSVSPAETNWHSSGSDVSILASANAGYSFADWSGDLTGPANPTFITMNGPRSATANFAASPPVSLAVTPSGPVSSSGDLSGPFSPSNHVFTLQNTGATPFDWKASKSQSWTSLSVETGSLLPGASTTVTVSINESANSLDSGSYSDSIAFTNITDDRGDTARSVNLTVNAGTLVTHKVNSHPTGLMVWVDGVSYKTPKKLKWQNGSLHTLSTVDPQEGPGQKRYRFSSWDDGGLLTHTVVAPSNATTYTADFVTEVSLETSVNDESRGIVSPSGTQWYEKGQTVSLTAVPLEGYHFKNWKNASGQVIGKENLLSVTMTGSKKIKASFAPITYPLVVSKIPSSGGTVSRKPSKTNYFPGEQVTLTAKPKYGYTFIGWGGDATGSWSTITITVDGQKTVIANFLLDPNVPRVAPTMEKTEERLPLIGLLESPGDGKTLSGVKPIYGWALDGEAVTKVELFIDGHYVCQIPYGGLREDIGETHPEYPEAEEAGFALVWNYSVLSAGEHTVGIRVHNSRGEALDLSARVSVIKFHGDVVTDMNPDTPATCPVTVTADGVTRTYDVNLQWVSEIQDFSIIDIVPKD